MRTVSSTKAASKMSTHEALSLTPSLVHGAEPSERKRSVMPACLSKYSIIMMATLKVLLKMGSAKLSAYGRIRISVREQRQRM